MATVTPTLEYYDTSGTAWRDITADYLQGTLRWSGGIRGSNPTDREAAPGKLEVELNNSAANSGGLLGYYSPNHTNRRSGWQLGAKIRISLTDGTNTRKWLRRINDITPAAGTYRKRRVEVVARDYIAEMGERKVSGLAIQQNKHGGELLPLLVERLPFAPENTSYGTGVFRFPYAFHTEQDESTYCLTVGQKISQSDLSYIYCDGDATDGETLVYEPHNIRMNNLTSVATLSDTMTDLDLQHTKDNVWNYVLCNTYPVEVGGDVEVIGRIREEFRLLPGETRTITIPYIDNATERRVSGERLIPPESVTDYKMSSYPVNGGSDLNAYIAVAPTAGANTMEVVVENTGTAIGYVNTLQIRGYTIKTAEKIGSISRDQSSIDAYGEKSLTYNMPYQSNSEFGQAVADEIVRRHKDPNTTISGVTFIANRNDTMMGYALTCGIGSRVTIAETVTGVNTDFFINGFEYELLSGNVLRVTWVLERAYNFVDYFTIDDAVKGAIDGAYLIAPF